MRVADGLGELHRLAPLQRRAVVGDQIRVQSLGHLVAEGGGGEAPLRATVDLGENKVEVVVVQMLGATADLVHQVCTADHVLKPPRVLERQHLARLFGTKGLQRNHYFRRAGDLGAQPLVLRADAHRAGVGVALADHDATQRDEAERADAMLLRSKRGGEPFGVTPGVEWRSQAADKPVLSLAKGRMATVRCLAG